MQYMTLLTAVGEQDTWHIGDSQALLGIFDTVYNIFSMEFQVLGFTTSLFSLIVTGFVLVFVLRLVGRFVNAD